VQNVGRKIGLKYFAVPSGTQHSQSGVPDGTLKIVFRNSTDLEPRWGSFI
jgi:hypothetical protein